MQRPAEVVVRVCFSGGKRPGMPLPWEERSGRKGNARPLSCLHTMVSAGTALFLLFFFFLPQGSLVKILNLKWSIEGKKAYLTPSCRTKRLTPPSQALGRFHEQRAVEPLPPRVRHRSCRVFC